MKYIMLLGAAICLLLMYFIAVSTTVDVNEILELPLSPDETCLNKIILSAPSGLNIIARLKWMYSIDMLFIVFYTSVLILWTHNEMNWNGHLWTNHILRFNLLIVLLAGILDAMENMIIWYNIETFMSDADYISSRIFAGLKYILIGWVLLGILTSKTFRKFGSGFAGF